MSYACEKCGDVWPRERMLSYPLFSDSGEYLCLRCASVALKGGPQNMTEEERRDHNVRLDPDA